MLCVRDQQTANDRFGGSLTGYEAGDTFAADSNTPNAADGPDAGPAGAVS